MSASVRHVWLGLTPEPERELPAAVAALRATPGRPEEIVAAEDRRIEALILHGTQRSWLRYLREVTGLVRSAVERNESLADALRAAETVLDHHRMLIGLPGSGYDSVAAERDELTRIVGDLRGRDGAGLPLATKLRAAAVTPDVSADQEGAARDAVGVCPNLTLRLAAK